MTSTGSSIKKVVFALCEGPHDTAFLYRLFTARGFTAYKEIIGNFPAPISTFIIRALKSSDYEKMKLIEVGKKPVPQEILTGNEALILLYALGGDGKKKARNELLSNVFEFNEPDEYTLDTGKGMEYSIIYFFDADEKGVDKRLKEVEQEINQLFGVENTKLSNGGEPATINGYKIGCYIFADKNGLGKLEDIMTPIMEKDNETIFKEADKFLQLKDESRLKKLRLKQTPDGSMEEYRSNKKMKFEKSKSKICIAGQLQNSGKSNTVIIKDCDFINLPKLRECSSCNEIADFIDRMVR